MDIIATAFSLALACELSRDFKCAEEKYLEAISLCPSGSDRELEIMDRYERFKVIWLHKKPTRGPGNRVGFCPPENNDYQCPMDPQESARLDK